MLIQGSPVGFSSSLALQWFLRLNYTKTCYLRAVNDKTRMERMAIIFSGTLKERWSFRRRADRQSLDSNWNLILLWAFNAVFNCTFLRLQPFDLLCRRFIFAREMKIFKVRFTWPSKASYRTLRELAENQKVSFARLFEFSHGLHNFALP